MNQPAEGNTNHSRTEKHLDVADSVDSACIPVPESQAPFQVEETDTADDIPATEVGRAHRVEDNAAQTTEIAENQIAAHTQSVGSKLKQLRQSKGETVESLAAKLRMEKSLIEAVESDDITCFPSLRYARAMVRSYCRALGEMDSALVTQFGEGVADSENSSPKPSNLISPLQKFKHSSYDDSAHKHYHMIWWVISVLILISALVIYFYPFPRQQANKQEQPTTEEVPVALKAELHIAPIASTTSADIVAIETVASAPVQQIVSTSEPFLATTQQTHATQQPSSVSIAFSARTWVGLFDAKGNEKLSAFYADNSKVLGMNQGDRLILGNVNAIAELRYQNQTVDLTPFTRGSVARMELNKQGDLTPVPVASD